MKLKMISEVIVADPDMVFNYLGNAAKQLFGGKKKNKLPQRYRRYEMKQVSYQRATDPRVKCETCKFFDPSDNTCVLVEGKINPDAVCRLWDQGGDDED
jgi:hypothetical protein